MEEPVLILIVGPQCAGKTTASEMLSQRSNWKVIRASDYPRARHRSNPGKLTLLEFVRHEFRTKGRDTFAKDLVKDLLRIKAAESFSGFIVDGFRAVEELNLVIRRVGDCNVFGVYADTSTRFRRVKKRDRSNALNYESFVHKDMVEYSFGVASLMSDYADAVLINESDFARLRTRLFRVARDSGLTLRN